MAQSKAQSVAPIRGIVRALNQASISIDLPVRVAKLNFREAQPFHKGDVLVTFDCRRFQAEHAAAVAASREMRLTLQSQSYLDTRGAVGKLDVEISRARVEKAEAEAAGIAARLEQCTVVAPFDGRITELKVNEYEVPANGQPFIGLIDETRFEIDLILPSYASRAVEPGTTFQFSVDETGQTYEAKLLRLGAAVDPVSQTIKAIAAFEKPDRHIVSGMSGTAVFTALEAVR
ncbi:MAG: efflux RND transporter periplasmic adaptor subunit [Proteobacteria bacterium]|nr:efflux RND transporter periplasmic adaptor subunit [Pseudomonadota bacterium]